MVYASFWNWKLAEIFFAKDRMMPEANHFNSFVRILENWNKQNKQREKPQELAWKFIELKYLDQLRKKTSVVSSWLRSRSPSLSPIDNCGLFIRHEEYKSQATSYKYRLCSHSLQQSRCQYSFSRLAKPAGGLKRLHNRRPK